ncbi:Alpha/Beta hydrolase protein [Obelidium mucronatum]|nr:Alpha/Beta hydrolase protein [Obelidium mucronatum]
MQQHPLIAVPNYINVEASGFGLGDINSELQSVVDSYSALKPTKLIAFAKDAAGGVFIKKRRQENLEDAFNGTEIFRVVDANCTQITDLCSGPNLGCNISSWKPVKSGAIFLRDVGGNEAPDLWEGMVDSQSVWTFHRLITNDSPKTKCSGICLSKNELMLVFTWNKRDCKCADVYTWTRATPTASWKDTSPVLAYQASGGIIHPFAFIENTRVLFGEAFSASRMDLHSCDVKEDGTIDLPIRKIEYPGTLYRKEVTFETLETSETDPDVIYIATNAYSDVFALAEVNLRTQNVRHITTPGNTHGASFPSPWDIEHIAMISDTMILFCLNEGGQSGSYLFDTSTWRIIQRLDTPLGVISNIIVDKTANRVSYAINSPSHPSLLFHFDVLALESTPFPSALPTTCDGKSNSPSVSNDPELITYTSFDGTKISAYLYRPPNPPSKPTPVLLYIHGGPASQYRPYYLPGNHSLSMRYLTNEMGITCIAPNIRGSTGYGTAFMESDDRLKRQDALKDIEALVHWVCGQPDKYDGSRVGIMGRSYGGWAVLASMVFYPGLFRCGLATCGISNYLTFFENTGPWRAEHRRKEYGDERDPVEREFLQKISPMLHADKIVAPLYLAIGENDTRVPLGEAVQMAQVVREKGKTVWLFVGKKEGHVFEQKSVQDFHAVAQVSFLKKFLMDANFNSNL